jgi:hypothetical protein
MVDGWEAAVVDEGFMNGATAKTLVLKTTQHNINVSINKTLFTSHDL